MQKIYEYVLKQSHHMTHKARAHATQRIRKHCYRLYALPGAKYNNVYPTKSNVHVCVCVCAMPYCSIYYISLDAHKKKKKNTEKIYAPSERITYIYISYRYIRTVHVCVCVKKAFFILSK